MNQVAMCVMFMFTMAKSAPAAEYHVSDSTGDDSRSRQQARNAATPWKTIQKAANKMSAGDTCTIHAGIYRETVKPRTGQTFQSQRDDYVLITGCDVVSGDGWKPHQGKIYKTEQHEKVYDVFVDGEYMNLAQYPNFDGNRNSQAAWRPTVASFVNRSTTKVVLENGEKQPDNHWQGGWYQGLNGENCYAGTCGNIQSSTQNTLTLKDVEFRQEYDNTAHFGTGRGYIINHLNCLDAEREWHWENRQLYLYAPGGGNPASKTVEARTRLYSFVIEVDDVKLTKLNFKAASIQLAGNRCTVQDCTFQYVSPWGKQKYPGQGTEAGYYNFGGPIDGTSGIHISGRDNLFKNNYVAHGWGALVSCRGQSNTIENNIIEDSNWLARQNTVNVQVSGTSQRIVHNTLRKSNAMLISIIDIEANQIYKTVVTHNNCQYWGYLNPDGGSAAIYRNGSDDSQGDVYAYNLIAHGMGEQGAIGIYMDDGSQNLTIHHNVIYLNNHGKIVRGIWFHGNFVGQSKIYAYNNTCYGLHGTEWNQAIGAYNRKGKYADIVYKNNLSDVDSFTNGTTIDADFGLAKPDDFVNIAQLDFNLTLNAKNAIDKGVVIPVITDGFAGSRPDLGAYERNGQSWVAGARLTVPKFPVGK